MAADLYRQVKVGDRVVRAIKGEQPPWWPDRAFKSAYRVLVDGEARGWLAYARGSAWTHRHPQNGWFLLSNVPSEMTSYGSAAAGRPGIKLAQSHHDRDGVLTKAIEMTDTGRCPLPDEIPGMLELADRSIEAQRTQRERDNAESARRNERTRQEAQERAEMIRLGLESLAQRTDLTNLERAAVDELKGRRW